MATHTRFDRDSGQITGYYSVDGALADLQARGISGIIPGQFDPDTEMLPLSLLMVKTLPLSQTYRPEHWYLYWKQNRGSE